MIQINEEALRKIQERYKAAPAAAISKFLRENSDVDQFLCELCDSEPEWMPTKRIAFSMAALGLFEPVRCKVCGKILDPAKYLNNPANRIQYCSRKCSQSAPERLEKVKKTSLERFGAENAMQAKAIQDKMKATNVERYGVENVFQSEEKKEKIRQTNLERYGAENYVQSTDWREKTVKTNQEKLGVNFPAQNPEVMEKVRQTNLERYGGVAPACSQEVVDKMKATNLERYGDEYTFNNPELEAKRQQTWQERYGGNPSSNDEVKRKRIETNLRLFGSESYYTSPEYLSVQYDKIVERFNGKVEPMFTREEYKGINCRQKYRWKCLKCGNEFESHIHITDFDEQDRMMPRCLNCHPYLKGESRMENEVFEFIKSIYDGKIVHGDRTVLCPKELDIYLPDKKFAIEFDGIHWHTDGQGKGVDYHLSKTTGCQEKGIHLVHIFEDEWLDKRSIVEDRIKSMLGIGQTRIQARKCDMKEISSEEASEFMDRNHLQGTCASSFQYGLYHNGELVSVMTFGRPRFNESYDWELIRFASRAGCHVVGGASKLLAEFRKSHSGSIISYADRRYSDGGLYERLGFTRTGVSSPNYWYIKGNLKLSRYQCQKHRLPALLGEYYFDDMTEEENMLFNGYERMYDCGNLVYAMK